MNCPNCGPLEESSVYWKETHRETRETPAEGFNLCVHCGEEVFEDEG